MVTSEPVRDRIVALTRSISAATSPTSSSIEALEGLSKGTITATPLSTFAQLPLSLVITIESAGECGKATMRLKCRVQPSRRADKRSAKVSGIGADQRYGAGFA